MILSPSNCFYILFKIRSAVFVWVYSIDVFSIPLTIPYGLDYCSFLVILTNG